MFYHQVYALIKDEIIQNICVCHNYEVANQVARGNYGSGSIAVDCTYYAVGVGDLYKNNTFYKKETGELAEYKGSEVENITWLKNDNTQIKKVAEERKQDIIDLCDMTIELAQLLPDENANGLTNKEKIICQAVAKKIKNGAYGEFDVEKIEELINEAKKDYDISQEMEDYIIVLLNKNVAKEIKNKR